MGKGASENTVRVYLASVRRFYESHEEVTVEALQAYKKELLKECRPSTVNTRIYGMNQYVKALRHCRKECQETVFDPPNAACTVPADFKLPAVKRQQKPFLNNVISKRDYEKLKRGLRKDQDLFWYFVVRFLGATGARVSELVQIRRSISPWDVWIFIQKAEKYSGSIFLRRFVKKWLHGSTREGWFQDMCLPTGGENLSLPGASAPSLRYWQNDTGSGRKRCIPIPSVTGMRRTFCPDLTIFLCWLT